MPVAPVRRCQCSLCWGTSVRVFVCTGVVGHEHDMLWYEACKFLLHPRAVFAVTSAETRACCLTKSEEHQHARVDM